MTDIPLERIAITGAAGGIGAALARHYARPGVVLELAGRNAVALEATAGRCRDAGAQVCTTVFDVRDEAALTAWVDHVTAMPDLTTLMLCAGVSSSVETSEDGQRWPETQWDLAREMDVNAKSTMLAANEAVRQLLQQLSDKHPVQIGMIASIAALTGLPSSPGYSASKAALVIYAEALRRLVRGTRIGVSVVIPGYVTSPMSRRYVGAKPFEISAEAAARRIAAGLAANRAKIVFPKLLAVGTLLLRLVPECLQPLFLKSFDFSVVRDSESSAAKGASC